TAATSALATKYLARPGGRTLGIFGTGRQAHAHAAVLSQVMQAERMLVCGSSRERSSRIRPTDKPGVGHQVRSGRRDNVRGAVRRDLYLLDLGVAPFPRRNL